MMLRSAVVTLLVLTLGGCSSPPEAAPPLPLARPSLPVPPASSRGPEGVWYQPPEPWDPDAPTIRLPRNPFVYDGEYATMELWRMKAWMWRTPDDVYRVQTRWKGDVLQWLPPFGNWCDLARFDGDRFVDSDGLPFVRIAANELPKEHRKLLTPREPHDYSITAMGYRNGVSVEVPR